MTNAPYARFLAGKRRADPATGLTELPSLPSALFPHQRGIPGAVEVHGADKPRELDPYEPTAPMSVPFWLRSEG